MKKQTLLIVFLFYSCALLAQKKEHKEIIRTLQEYISKWGRLDNRFYNQPLIEVLEQASSAERSVYLEKRILDPFLSVDTLMIEGEQFLSVVSEQYLKKSNRKVFKIHYKELKRTMKQSIKISAPLRSIDGTTALVYLTISCGPLCGSGELFILKKEGDEWLIKDRIFKYVAYF